MMLFIALGVVQSLTLAAVNVSQAAHFGGMFMGLMLVTGFWKPRKILERIKLWRMRRRYKKLKTKLNIVDRDGPGGGGYYH